MDPHIYVCPLSQLYRSADALRPSHVITLIDPDTPVETPKGLAPERHLKLSVHDINDARVDHTHPAEDHVHAIIDFVSSWDHASPLLVHCWAGISRSTATAYLTMCLFNEPGNEAELARQLRRRAPHAHPNRLIVRHADRILGRQGRMMQAIETLGPGQMVWEGELFGVPLRPLPPGRT